MDYEKDSKLKQFGTNRSNIEKMLFSIQSKNNVFSPFSHYLGTTKRKHTPKVFETFVNKGFSGVIKKELFSFGNWEAVHDWFITNNGAKVSSEVHFTVVSTEIDALNFPVYLL